MTAKAAAGVNLNLALIVPIETGEVCSFFIGKPNALCRRCGWTWEGHYGHAITTEDRPSKQRKQ